jgi:heat shock protein HtpX
MIGFTPGNMQLVLSRGVLDTCTDEELDAVIAHELAHIKHRDAVLLTILAVPISIAEGLRSKLHTLLTGGDTEQQDEDDFDALARESSAIDRVFVSPLGALKIYFVPLYLLRALATVVAFAGRTAVAPLSRHRELAADRVAATVTGSPEAIASAIYRLDERANERPHTDLRTSTAIRSLEFVSPDAEYDPTPLGPDGGKTPIYHSLKQKYVEFRRRCFRPHPDVQRRIDALDAAAE